MSCVCRAALHLQQPSKKTKCCAALKVSQCRVICRSGFLSICIVVNSIAAQCYQCEKKREPLAPMIWQSDTTMQTRPQRSCREAELGRMRTRGVFRPKPLFFRFLLHPRAHHCSLTAMLSQNFSNHQLVMCSGHTFSFLSACLWPAMGWFGGQYMAAGAA